MGVVDDVAVGKPDRLVAAADPGIAVVGFAEHVEQVVAGGRVASSDPERSHPCRPRRTPRLQQRPPTQGSSLTETRPPSRRNRPPGAAGPPSAYPPPGYVDQQRQDQ